MFLVDVRGKTPFAGKFKSFTGAVKEVVCPPNQSLVFSVSLDRHLRVHDIVTRKLVLKVFTNMYFSMVSSAIIAELAYYWSE